jgi:hypothetical protein
MRSAYADFGMVSPAGAAGDIDFYGNPAPGFLARRTLSYSMKRKPPMLAKAQAARFRKGSVQCQCSGLILPARAIRNGDIFPSKTEPVPNLPVIFPYPAWMLLNMQEAGFGDCQPMA